MSSTFVSHHRSRASVFKMDLFYFLLKGSFPPGYMSGTNPSFSQRPLLGVPRTLSYSVSAVILKAAQRIGSNPFLRAQVLTMVLVSGVV
jgi:hypothetical protein